MVGTVSSGELSAASHAAALEGVRFAVATVDDDAAIRQLLHETPMRGAVSVTFEREPHYFAGAGIAGANDQTIVAYDRDRLLCIGRCTTREAWVNGEVRRVGYLAELRLHPRAQGRFDILRGGYRFFRELHAPAPADVYFTSIAADNLRARRLLERGAPGLPRYTFLAEFATLLIPVGRVSDVASGSVVPNAPYPQLVDFLNASARRHQLAAHWTAERLESLGAHGLARHDFVAIRSARGELLGCAALWDQRAFRQTKIHAYGGALRRARPLLNLLAPLLGRPRLPAPGTVLAQAFASPLACAPEQPAALLAVVNTLRRAAAARGLDWLTLGFAASDPRVATLQSRFRCRTYRTRLYRVGWPGEPAFAFDARPFQPEVALL